ncbi:hypothetical protein F2Q69_00029010 [Brassica cretica]|uniref:Uncharacterized protein n=1 Tax=Brassica cretica TaxID=69181 RepID=A0A8S9RRZ0_BRACR|nr:hypothetical protein F2Q69_00029010 [Brassica cretica]
MFGGVFSVPVNNPHLRKSGSIIMRRRLALRLRVPDLYPPEDEAHGGAREVDCL